MTHPHARAPCAPEMRTLPNHYFATTTPLLDHYSATTRLPLAARRGANRELLKRIPRFQREARRENRR